MFATTIIGDLTWRRFTADKEVLPADAVQSQDFGPFLVLAQRTSQWPKRKRLWLWLQNERWVLTDSEDSQEFHALGESSSGVLRRTLFGYTLSCADTVVLLPPRYNGLIREVSLKSKSKIEDKGAAFNLGFSPAS